MNDKTNGNKEPDRLFIKFLAYLNKALNDTMINYCREQRKQRAIYDMLIVNSSSLDNFNDIYAQSPYFQAQFDNPTLEEALKKLNDRYRYILYAHIVEERSFGEIGEELCMNYKGVAALYYRARNKLREEMRSLDGFCEPDAVF